MKPCDAIRPHLSALVDGALEPLEVIAIHRHLDRCSACRREVAALEQLKVRVHLAGRDAELSTNALAALERTVLARGRAAARARRARRVRRAGLGLGAALAAAAALWLTLAPAGVLETRRAAPGGVAAVAAVAASGPVTLDGDALRALVHASRRSAVRPAGPPTDPLARLRPALVSVRGLPGGLVETQGERSRIVLASYPTCGDAEAGATLAVLRADRVTLPPAVRAGLDTRGVYVDVVSGAEVRVTEAAGELFVLVRALDDLPGGDDGAI